MSPTKRKNKQKRAGINIFVLSCNKQNHIIKKSKASEHSSLSLYWVNQLKAQPIEAYNFFRNAIDNITENSCMSYSNETTVTENAVVVNWLRWHELVPKLTSCCLDLEVATISQLTDRKSAQHLRAGLARTCNIPAARYLMCGRTWRNPAPLRPTPSSSSQKQSIWKHSRAADVSPRLSTSLTLLLRNGACVSRFESSFISPRWLCSGIFTTRSVNKLIRISNVPVGLHVWPCRVKNFM